MLRHNNNYFFSPEAVLDGFGAAGAFNSWVVRTDLLQNFLEHQHAPAELMYVTHLINTASMLFSELPHNLRRNRKLYADFRRNFPNRLPFPMIAALVGAFTTAVIQSIILYESEKDLVRHFGITSGTDAEKLSTSFIRVSVIAGALQEFAHGGMELFSAAIEKRALFYNGRLMPELFVNFLFIITALGEASIYYGESSVLLADQRKWGIKMFALVNAVMILSENHEVIKAINNYKKFTNQPSSFVNLNPINALFHGISRYQMISHILETTILKNFSDFFSPTAAITLGLTKWTILEAANRHNLNYHGISVQLPYTGYLHGIDISYFLAFYSFLLFFKTTSTEGQDTLLISNIAANFITEAVYFACNYCCSINNNLDEKYLIFYPINILLSPILVAATYFRFISYLGLETENQTKNYLEHSTPVMVVLLTMIYKHLLNKLTIKAFIEHQPDENLHVHYDRPEDRDDEVNRVYLVNENKEEAMPLIQHLRPESPILDRPPRRISLCEKIVSYFPALGFFAPVRPNPAINHQSIRANITHRNG